MERNLERSTKVSKVSIGGPYGTLRNPHPEPRAACPRVVYRSINPSQPTRKRANHASICSTPLRTLRTTLSGEVPPVRQLAREGRQQGVRPIQGAIQRQAMAQGARATAGRRSVLCLLRRDRYHRRSPGRDRLPRRQLPRAVVAEHRHDAFALHSLPCQANVRAGTPRPRDEGLTRPPWCPRPGARLPYAHPYPGGHRAPPTPTPTFHRSEQEFPCPSPEPRADQPSPIRTDVARPPRSGSDAASRSTKPTPSLFGLASVACTSASAWTCSRWPARWLPSWRPGVRGLTLGCLPPRAASQRGSQRSPARRLPTAARATATASGSGRSGVGLWSGWG